MRGTVVGVCVWGVPLGQVVGEVVSMWVTRQVVISGGAGVWVVVGGRLAGASRLGRLGPAAGYESHGQAGSGCV